MLCCEYTPEDTIIDIESIDFRYGIVYDWQKLTPEKVYICNSVDEVTSYIPDGKDIPSVDFNTYSLIVVTGISSKNIVNLTKYMQQVNSDYRLTIDMELSDYTTTQRWSVAIQIPKIPENSKIDLVINRNNYSGCSDPITQVCSIYYFRPPDTCDDYIIIRDTKTYKPMYLSDDFKLDTLPLSVSVIYCISDIKHNCGFGGDIPVINIIKIMKID